MIKSGKQAAARRWHVGLAGWLGTWFICLAMISPSWAAVVIQNGSPGANGTAGSAGDPGTNGGNGGPGSPDPVVANTGTNFDPTNTAQATGGAGGSGGNGGAGNPALNPNAAGGNGGNGGKGASAQATAITTSNSLVAPVSTTVLAQGGAGGVLGLGGAAAGSGAPGADGVSGAGGAAEATGSALAIGSPPVVIDVTAIGGAGGDGHATRASNGALGGNAQAGAVGSGGTTGANLFSILATATGGAGGDAVSSLGGNGGAGGSALADANGNKTGAAPTTIPAITAIALGGAGGAPSAGGLPGSGGAASANANGTATFAIAVNATATGGATPGLDADGMAVARAKATAASGSATAQANSGGALTPLVSTTAIAPVASLSTAESRAAAASSFPNLALADNLQAAAYAVGTPLGSDVTAVVADNLHAQSMVDGADSLGLFYLSGAYSASGSGAAKTFDSSATFTIDLTQLTAPHDLQLAVVDARMLGTGFDDLHLEVIREGLTVVSEVYANPVLALATLTDHVLNLDDIETGIGDNLLDVTVRLSVTTNDPGASFGAMFVLANSALPTWDADFDEDSDVDDVDLATWEAGYGAGATHAQGDADRDGDVDGRDFLIWQRQYTGSIFAEYAAVPEPATGLLTFLASIIAACRRRRGAAGLQPRGFGSR